MEQEPSSGTFPNPDGPVPVLCLDDNEWIGESIARMLRHNARFKWVGWLPSAEGLKQRLEGLGSALLLMDVDVPGQDSFEVVSELREQYPELRVIMLSGHVHLELVDRGINAGAWGYVSKNEETHDILQAMERVCDGQVAFSPSILEQYQRQ
jgi:two-component system, NarL family, invasion response regulator UvrY